jgi:hypothetical protein
MPAFSYEKIKEFFESKNCKLLTTKEEFINNKMNAKNSKYNIISSCGHNTPECYFHTFKNRNTGVLCKECIINNSRVKKISNNFETEDNAFEIIKKLISDIFEVNINGECVSADLCIKLKNEKNDLWLPLQLKSTAKPDKTTFSFHLDNKIYENMLIIFICIKPIKIFIFDSNDEIIRNKKKLTIGFKSKYKEFEVDKEKLSNKLIEIYELKQEYLLSKNVIDMPITQECKLEKEFQIYRQNIFKNIPFVASKNYEKTDFCINSYNIQEKTATIRKNRINTLIVTLQTGNQNLPYDIKDNDYYWINYPDKTKFILISSNILYQNGYLKNNNIIQSGTLSFKIELTKKYEWLKPYIYEYNLETEKIILDIFNNLPKKEIINNIVDINELIDNNKLEQEKYINTLVQKKPEKKCVDCGIKVFRTSMRCNPCAQKERRKIRET